MKIELDIPFSDEELKKAFCYTDKVHRLINGEEVEIDNPLSLLEYITKDTIGHIENKVTKKGSCC